MRLARAGARARLDMRTKCTLQTGPGSVEEAFKRESPMTTMISQQIRRDVTEKTAERRPPARVIDADWYQTHGQGD